MVQIPSVEFTPLALHVFAFFFGVVAYMVILLPNLCMYQK